MITMYATSTRTPALPRARRSPEIHCPPAEIDDAGLPGARGQLPALPVQGVGAHELRVGHDLREQRAGKSTVLSTPVHSATAYTIHIWAGSRTASSGSIPSASSRSVTTSSRRRSQRSASIPATDPSSTSGSRETTSMIAVDSVEPVSW
ncbi:hypothetical protein [Nonomuraea longispora]|uniref:hypothetical protein n=1 Tax=Nonomuraea longispora TaxID=1848320 RepID=UPI001FE77A74|nr:hypothetical protein [Nonomuraea longispora]